jgi:DNA processing protein
MELITEIHGYQDFYNSLGERERSRAPKNVFHQGDISLLDSSCRIAVVGSRNVSSEGIVRTKAITKLLVEKGVVVVSGLAQGVDAVAHNQAIYSGGKTISVLGTPLDKASPKSNEELLKTIKRDHLALSQFEIGHPIYPSNFPKRNLLMALISDATVIVEASENSGTRHQAWEALRIGRDVFIMENVIEKNLSWVNKALDYGAIILTRENVSNELDRVILSI